MDKSPPTKLQLPGFRFHPTEEELIEFYLKNTIEGKTLHYDVIGVVNIYSYDPWYLPGLYIIFFSNFVGFVGEFVSN